VTEKAEINKDGTFIRPAFAFGTFVVEKSLEIEALVK